MDSDRLQPHGLVSELRRAEAPVERKQLDTGIRTADSTESELLRSAHRNIAQALESLGGFGDRLSRLSYSHAQRALPLHHGGQPNYESKQRAAQRARNRLGDGHSQ